MANDIKKIEVPMFLRGLGVTPEVMQQVGGIGEQLQVIPARIESIEHRLESIEEKLDVLINHFSKD